MRECLSDFLRDEIALRLDDGEGLAEVDHELIERASRLSEDERAALWLFAWSYRPSGSSQPGRFIGSLAQ
jgi:hypothetical protein